MRLKQTKMKRKLRPHQNSYFEVHIFPPISMLYPRKEFSDAVKAIVFLRRILFAWFFCLTL